MSVNSKMTAIADAIREKTGGTDALTLDGMAAAIPNVYAAGEDAEAARVAAKQFICTLYGNDTNTVSVAVPFQPDFFCIASFDAYLSINPSTYYFAIHDFRAAALPITSFIRYIKSNGAASTSSFSYTGSKSIFSYSDGMLTIDPTVGGTELQAAKWRSEVLYVLAAFKYTDKTDKEILTTQIGMLPDSGGTIIFAQDAISAAFTDDEWATLIATKPNWTFTLA